MRPSEFLLEPNSYLASELPPASAAWESMLEGQGRGCEASRALTRVVVLKAAPWLILLLWSVLTYLLFSH